MIFTEVRFALLLASCWFVFFAVPARLRSVILALWGIAFYALYAGQFLPLVVLLIAAAYYAGRGGASMAVIVALVALFAAVKLGFSPGVWFTPTGTRAALSPLVPLGYSFLAFELLHFLIERRRGRLEAASLFDLAAFALFFPCRVAGPIKRYPAFVDAIAAARPSSENVYLGLVRILTGLFKKIVLADTLATTVA